MAAATEAGGAISYTMLQDAANAELGHGLSMPEDAFAGALTAENFVAVRDIFGGPAPTLTRAALARQRELEATNNDWLAKARRDLESRDRRLRQTIEETLG